MSRNTVAEASAISCACAFNTGAAAAIALPPQIDVPILTFSGELETDNYLHLDLLKEKAIKCPSFSSKIIKDSNHFYHNKENEISSLIYNWIKRCFFE